ncbi:MAG TPA: cation:proton antiporter [Micromonosporaceae bacterium]
MVVAAPTAPLAGRPLLLFLVALAVLLLAARLLGRLAERARQPRIVGELLTGLLLGPSVLGLVAPEVALWLLPPQPEQAHLLDAIGHLSVLLLVGITGTQLDLRMLGQRGTAAVAATVSLSALVVPLGLGFGLGWLLPDALISETSDRWLFASFLAVAMCVSAIPVIAKTLSDLRLLHRDIAQLTLAAGMLDDTVAWLLLTVVTAAATVGVSAGQISISVAYLLGLVIFAATVGRAVVRRLMRLVARTPESGPTVATTVVLILIGAAVTQVLDMDPVFGAFVAGILIGAPGAVDQAKLAPLRTVVLTVLAPIYLALAGLRMDLTALADPLVALAAVSVLAVAVIGKFGGAYLGARLSRRSNWEALALGAGLNARGVIEVIVAMTGLRLGVLTTATYTIVLLVAIATSLMAPPLLRLAMARIPYRDEERERAKEHEAWAGR